MANKILLSVDMDEWYQCRWATGSATSLWPDVRACFREYYGSDTPAGEIKEHTELLLDLFAEFEADATFFFTGEVARFYPELVRRIADLGYEIGSHNDVHQDFHEGNRADFARGVRDSRKLLQDLSGQPVLGYRAPNSTIAPYMIGELLDAGYKYDSSVTPTRAIMGKFGGSANAPLNPYQLSAHSFEEPGDSGLWEFPWPVFPLFRLPAGSGIMTRIAGYHYNMAATRHALKTGHTTYYFHPYEVGPPPKLPRTPAKVRLFLRRCGRPYARMLRRMLAKHQGRFASGRELLALVAGEGADSGAARSGDA